MENILSTRILRLKTPVLRSNLGEYSDAYIAVKGKISVACTNNANRGNKKLTLKNNALFRSCIKNINNAFIGNAEHLHIIVK